MAWDTGRIAIVVLLAAAALLLISPPVRAVTVVEGHPRVLMYADSLAALRSRSSGANSASYTLLYNYYNPRRNYGDNFAARWIDDMAALYLISQETKWADAAIRQTMKLVRAGTPSAGGIGRTSPVASTYDWCYDRLSPAQKDSIVAYCLRQLDVVAGPAVYYRSQDLRWQFALAIWGEAGDRNDFVDGILQACIDLAEDHVFPCLDAISSGGTFGYYPGVYVSNYMNFIDCLRFATGYAGPILHSSYWVNSPTYWIHRFRPDLRMMRMTGRYNTSDVNRMGYMAYFANREGNRYAQTIANILAQVGGNDGEEILSEVLWYLPNGATEPLSSFPRTFADEDYGYYLHRSGWTLGTGSTDIQVGFYNGPDVEPDREKTQNSFTVTRGADDLLISAGHFYYSSDQHYVHYSARSISRNTILVYDPAESFGSGVPNDGGQAGSDMQRGRALWPECGSGIGYRGDADLLPESDGLVFGVRGSATAAYSRSKVSGVCRELRMPRENWIFLQDRVSLAKPGLPVRIVFHSIEKPTVDGTLEQVEGTSYGGTWRSTDSHVITVRRGISAAKIYPLYVRGGRVEVRIVGGASSSNLTWRQNLRSSAILTYVSDPAAQAYECWVDGANRSPTHDGLTWDQMKSRNREPHACGDWRVEILVQDAPTEVYAVTAIEIGARGIPERSLPWSESGGTVMVTVPGTPDDFSVHLPPPACAD
jgi:hypothetical protein